MNAAHVHLILNHFPPIVAVVASVVLATGTIWRRSDVRRTGALLIVLAAAIAVPVYLSGEPAEEIVEDLAGVNATAIEPHEDSAKWALALLIVAGVASLASLFFFRAEPELPNWAIATLLILALFATAASVRTALLGGRIRHPETMMRAG